MHMCTITAVFSLCLNVMSLYVVKGAVLHHWNTAMIIAMHQLDFIRIYSLLIQREHNRSFFRCEVPPTFAWGPRQRLPGSWTGRPAVTAAAGGGAARCSGARSARTDTGWAAGRQAAAPRTQTPGTPSPVWTPERRDGLLADWVGGDANSAPTEKPLQCLFVCACLR